ncbi:hypothetical protein CFP56_026198 [Quercus suber]|uniref:Uncharacterized protein n=1 Tax=Quercus suber TaxID=58331 RepID=A0AAW0K0N4_QUESU
MIEETVKSCLSPLFKELLSNAMGSSGFGGRGIGFGGMGMNAMAMNAMPLNFGEGRVAVWWMRSGGNSRYWSWRCTRSGWIWCRIRFGPPWTSCGRWEGD